MPRVYVVEDDDEDIQMIKSSFTGCTCRKREVLWTTSSCGTVFIKKIITKGIWRIDFIFISSGSSFEGAIGIASSDYTPSRSSYLGNDWSSVDYHSCGDCYHSRSTSGNRSWRSGDIVGIELYFFLNGVIQQVSYCHIPESVKIGVCTKYANMGIRIMRFRELDKAERESHASRVKMVNWEHNDSSW
eukprot:MONOS_5263.1-p1 / transcript=MONOS_5263.1 / gene=MONOS_5263 / organism=Monocercomonoides_exilis_PA203 / gene_product=unspecified product / transcript_product=unspecified product / location=Mono_scaffold00151:63940-64995(-) / protein_length=187 / sequence_SO=supercontig / SO=protein_coding / is_pseudo=false